jgi:hypothetical protein
MLRRETDHAVHDDLHRRLESILAGVRPDSPPDQRRTEIRCAVRALLGLLRTARERRLSRGEEARARRPKGRMHLPGGKSLWITAGLVLLVGGGVWGFGLRSDKVGVSAQAAQLAAQMAEAVKTPRGGEAGATHVFGGALRLEWPGGRPLVIAEGVPPGACVAASWTLVRGGLLTINGVTPNRVTALKMTELCHQDEGDATLSWMPK